MAIQDTYNDIEQTLGLVPEWIKQMPEGGAQGFWTSAKEFWLAETQIPNKYKELIGIAVSGATRCHYCTLFHTETAKLYGATDAEIAEASMMSAITMLGSTFINSQQINQDQFKQETFEIINYLRRNAPKPSDQATTERAHH